MGRIFWSDRAQKDLNSIFRYIANDSVFYAERFIISLVNSTNKLKDMPYSGRVVPELFQLDFRELIYKNYRVVYRIKNDNIIEIIAVIHSAREFETAFEN